MTAKLTITVSNEFLASLRTNKPALLRFDAAAAAQSRPFRMEEPRPGTLPARVIDWANKRDKGFGTRDITRRFHISRAHASMLLSRLASGPYPIVRERRGLYTYSA